MWVSWTVSSTDVNWGVALASDAEGSSLMTLVAAALVTLEATPKMNCLRLSRSMGEAVAWKSAAAEVAMVSAGEAEEVLTVVENTGTSKLTKEWIMA